MAFFGITIETIAAAQTHPGADRLDVCTLEGMAFQFVTKRGEYRSGDRVLYFPIDALLPLDLMVRLGLEGRLAGPEKNRIKTVRLRGEISQGIVASLELLEGLAEAERNPEEITRFLQVGKYEPPAIFDRQGRLMHLPLGLPVYDIEGADRFASVLEIMLDLEVAVSEKLEGSNFSVTVAGDRVWVNQRQHTIEPVADAVHSFWRTAERQGALDLARKIAAELGEPVTLYGEFLGPRVQSNIYKLKDHAVYYFDIRVGLRFLAVETFLETMRRHAEPHIAPQLAVGTRLRDWLGERTVQQAATGPSALGDTRREGIVLRPMEERYSAELNGRLILKQRSPEYLEKSDA